MHTPEAWPLTRLKAQLCDLNASDDCPFILREEGSEVVASWNIADARWRAILGNGGLKKQYELRLFFDESKKQVSYREKTVDLEWNADYSSVSVQKSVHVGKRLEFSAGSVWGVKEDGHFGKIAGYRFSSTEISDRVFNVVREAGWQVRGVLANGRSRKFIIAGVIAAVLAAFIGVGILLYTLLGGMKDAARAEIDLLRGEDYAGAWEASAASLQRKISREDFMRVFEALRFPDIVDYSFTQLRSANDVGYLSGSVEFKDGTTGEINIMMHKEDGQWKLAGVSVD
ncbi:hypothetical protein [Intestinirhabdus alba]|jgi:hypothetical protein|uniref:DUF4864 domain-containing protein n=1 Tax=Intestinirhabdus alba TaxID=2899544 RepID=A0A6L6IMD6_9ENTR|nr:hypothetical protein [Intestinirhabdus alba]MTH47659.1 hypothetical protein [Intestinirhabdus alba]